MEEGEPPTAPAPLLASPAAPSSSPAQSPARPERPSAAAGSEIPAPAAPSAGSSRLLNVADALDLPGAGLLASLRQRGEGGGSGGGGEELARTQTATDGIPRCAICLADPCLVGEREVTTTPCGHTFCVGCLESAVAVKPECPNCRAALQPPEDGAAAAARPARPPPLQGEELRWYEAEHRRHAAAEAVEAARIRRSGLRPHLFLNFFKEMPLKIVWCCLFLVTVAEVRHEGGESCMEAFDSTSFVNFSAAEDDWPVEGDCAEGDIACLQLTEADVDQRWVDLLHYMKMQGIFTGLSVGLALCVSWHYVNMAKLEPNKKVTALLGCCLCCCGCCGVALPFWIFFIKIIVAFFDISDFCSGNAEFDQVRTLLQWHWGFFVVNLCLLTPCFKRATKARAEDLKALSLFTWRQGDPVTLPPRAAGILGGGAAGPGMQARILGAGRDFGTQMVMTDEGRVIELPGSDLNPSPALRIHRGLQNVERVRTESRLVEMRGQPYFVNHHVRTIRSPDDEEVYLYGLASGAHQAHVHHTYEQRDAQRDVHGGRMEGVDARVDGAAPMRP